MQHLRVRGFLGSAKRKPFSYINLVHKNLKIFIYIYHIISLCTKHATDNIMNSNIYNTNFSPIDLQNVTSKSRLTKMALSTLYFDEFVFDEFL